METRVKVLLDSIILHFTPKYESRHYFNINMVVRELRFEFLNPADNFTRTYYLVAAASVAAF